MAPKPAILVYFGLCLVTRRPLLLLKFEWPVMSALVFLSAESSPKSQQRAVTKASE